MSVPDSPLPEPSRLRASDADRDRIAGELREALVEGRLTAEEHAERIDAVYTAKTYAELEPIVADLPAPGSGRPAAQPLVRDDAADLAPPHAEPSGIVAIFSGSKRKGRWLVPPKTEVTAIFGGVELDLRRAVLSQREVTISINAIFGGVEVTVPPGVRVANSLTGVFGGSSGPPDDTDDLDAPVIRITGFAMFGGVDIKRRSNRGRNRYGQRVAEIRQRRQELREHRREMREQRREIHQGRREFGQT